VAGLGGRVTELVALAVVDIAVRVVEPHLPGWLARLLLGWPTPPTYAAPAMPAVPAAPAPAPVPPAGPSTA
jgi:hypothetical protein